MSHWAVWKILFSVLLWSLDWVKGHNHPWCCCSVSQTQFEGCCILKNFCITHSLYEWDCQKKTWNFLISSSCPSLGCKAPSWHQGIEKVHQTSTAMTGAGEEKLLGITIITYNKQIFVSFKSGSWKMSFKEFVAIQLHQTLDSQMFCLHVDWISSFKKTLDFLLTSCICMLSMVFARSIGPLNGSELHLFKKISHKVGIT